MKTKIIKVDSEKPCDDAISEAAEVIRLGGLVAFPTETVYGLGANAFDVQAIKKIFLAKGRPSDNPLIVHVVKIDEVTKVAADFTHGALKLSRLWPGPLTMILKKHVDVPSLVTAGLDSVAVRIPDHPVAKALIEKAGVPIAAPSANRSGKPSPTLAEHVVVDLRGRIDMILDAGPTRVGLESTVVDLTTHPPLLLRPGGVSYEELVDILGEVEIHSTVLEKGDVRSSPSPGMKYQHYAPDSELILIEGDSERVIAVIRSLVAQLHSEGKRVGVLTIGIKDVEADVVISLGCDPNDVAMRLFDSFRRFNKSKVDVILAEDVDKQGIGLAIANRLRRAASETIRV